MDRVPAKAFLAVAVATIGCGSRSTAQCGVASLSRVLARLGRPVPYRELLARTKVVSGHTTFADLQRSARDGGVSMRGYWLGSPRQLGPNDMGIVELAADHFVALVGRKDGAFLVVDSPDGENHEPTEWSAARLEAEWTGNVLLVERTVGTKAR